MVPMQTEQRAEAGDDFEENEAAFEPHDLAAGVGLDGLGVLFLGPAGVHQAGADEAGEGGVLIDGELLDQGGLAAVAEIVDGPARAGLITTLRAQRDDALEDDGDGDDAASDQRHHHIPGKDERIGPGA